MQLYVRKKKVPKYKLSKILSIAAVVRGTDISNLKEGGAAVLFSFSSIFVPDFFDGIIAVKFIE